MKKGWSLFFLLLLMNMSVAFSQTSWKSGSWENHLLNVGESVGPEPACSGYSMDFTVDAVMTDVGDLSQNTFEWAVYAGSITSFNGTSISANSSTISGHIASYQSVYGVIGTTAYSITVQWESAQFAGAYVAVRQTSAFGCSDGLWSVFYININEVAPPTGPIVQEFCDVLNPVVGDLVATGTLIQWYTADNGGIALDPATELVPGSYFASQTVNECESTLRLEVTVVFLYDRIWTGTISTDWNNSGNWGCGVVPLLTTNVRIPDVPNKPILSSGAVGTAKDIFIESGSSLTVTGNTIQIAGLVTTNGTFTATSGIVEMKGSAAQTIGPDVFYTNTIMDLIINNSNGVTLLGPLNISGVVTALNGNLSSDGHLTLLSTNAQTALVDGIGTGQITGNVTTQRYLSSGIGYKYVSSPFQSAEVSEFADDLNLGAAFATFYAYDEDHHVDSAGTIRYSSGWVKYLAGPLVPMVGYAANFGGSATPKTMDITGSLNNNLSSTLTIHNHNRQYTNGFNLVGNPYPSPIDWNSTSGWVKANIENALYYFDASDEYTGTYSSYIAGASSDGVASNLIPAMQGFFVRVADGSVGTFGIGNGARVNNLNALYHKSAPVENRSLIRISAGYDTEGAIADPAVIYFDDLATPEFSGEQDALKLMNTDEKVPSLFTVSSDNKQLSINGLNYEGKDMLMIPLGINTLQPGHVNFKATDTERVPLGLHVYLFDAETGMHQDLQNSIQYRVYLQSGEHKNRFWLKLSQTDLVQEPLATHDFFAWCSGNDLRIKLLLDPDETGVLSVCNLMGQVVWKMAIGGMGYEEISKRLATGMYIISLYRATGIQSQKIYIPTE